MEKTRIGIIGSGGISNAHMHGYNKLKDITRVGCWAHLRRKFVEAIPTKKTDSPPTSAEIGRQYCDKLFAIEYFSTTTGVARKANAVNSACVNLQSAIRHFQFVAQSAGALCVGVSVQLIQQIHS